MASSNNNVSNHNKKADKHINDRNLSQPDRNNIVTAQSRNHIVTNSSVPTQSRNHQILSAITSRMETAPTDIVLYRDAFDCLRNIEQEIGERDVKLSADLKKRLRAGQLKAKESGDRAFQTGAYEVNRKILCWEAPVLFDSYMLYMEMNRPFEKQFYMPRRKQLLRAVNAMQDLSERRLKLLGISMPPGVGKTSLALFFLTWEAGRHPDQPMLTGSHNKDFLAGTYGECLRLLDPKGEYLWNDVFPELKVTQTNAKTLMIDIGSSDRDRKRFMTLEFSSVGSGNAGKVRAQNLLYCDDLVDGIETALSKDRLDKLWGMYTDDLRQRKIGDCAELHIATRWSVHDVIGRLEQKYGHTDTAKFIVMPALDENDESNFDYPIPQGFTTAFYREQRDIMDDASWRALYQNEPIEREGQLYSENELRYYFELPDREPDAILAVCDTKDRGSDYCVMPIAYQYGQDYYIDKVVCENYAPTIVDEQLIMALVDRKVQMCQFESNSAGGKTAEKVQKGVKEKGGITRITTRWTTANKETKIIVNSPWVKEHCLFKDNSVIKDDKEYREFKKLLHGYTMAGNNKHDDVPDAMAQFALFVQNLSTAQVSVQHSPFR